MDLHYFVIQSEHKSVLCAHPLFDVHRPGVLTLPNSFTSHLLKEVLLEIIQKLYFLLKSLRVISWCISTQNVLLLSLSSNLNSIIVIDFRSVYGLHNFSSIVEKSSSCSV